MPYPCRQINFSFSCSSAHITIIHQFILKLLILRELIVTLEIEHSIFILGLLQKEIHDQTLIRNLSSSTLVECG